MRDALLWLVQALLIIQAISGVVAIWSHWKKNHKLERWVLTLLTIAGPATLALCWQTQLLFRDQEAIFWGRLMAGNEAWIFRLGSLGLIASSGLALGALSLSKHAFKRPLITGAVFVALSWYILYLHPTPHYVPVPSWIDKTDLVCRPGRRRVFLHFDLCQTAGLSSAPVYTGNHCIRLGFSDVGAVHLFLL
jgi:hypothetical protein